jgi:hypothetical protein
LRRPVAPASSALPGSSSKSLGKASGKENRVASDRTFRGGVARWTRVSEDEVGRAGARLEAAVLFVGALTVLVGATTTVLTGGVTTGARITGVVTIDRCGAGDVVLACGAGSGDG